MTEQSTPAVPESATAQPSHHPAPAPLADPAARPQRPSQTADAGHNQTAYATASPAKTPNARISRLSHEWRSPRTARYA